MKKDYKAMITRKARMNKIALGDRTGIFTALSHLHDQLSYLTEGPEALSGAAGSAVDRAEKEIREMRQYLWAALDMEDIEIGTQLLQDGREKKASMNKIAQTRVSPPQGTHWIYRILLEGGVKVKDMHDQNGDLVIVVDSRRQRERFRADDPSERFLGEE